MKNFRRILSLVLVLCLCFSLTAMVSAEETEAHNHESENNLVWHLSEDGALTIGGTGRFCTLNSAEEQPWAEVREQIVSVHFDPDAPVIAKDIAYWFAGCTNLVYAEVPGFWAEIGAYAFADCDNLQELLILTKGTPVIDDTAFAGTDPSDLWIMVTSEESYEAVQAANWHGRSVEVENVGGISLFSTCGISGCYCSSCSWYKKTKKYDEYDHITYEQCDSCSANEFAYGVRDEHTFRNGYCTVCGYEEPAASCTHGRYYTQWSGCDWYEYCYYCDELMDYGTSHGTTTYGTWTYYSTSQHRRTYACSDCGEGAYEYSSHSTTNQYAQYSASQHSVTKYCATCGSNVGSTTYASHSLAYSNWTSYSASQHSRTKSCATCGYSSSEYGSHADTNSDGKCDTCGYSMSVTITWDAHTNGGSVNGVQSVTTSAPIGYSATAPSYTPVKTGHTFKGWYTAASGGSLYSSVSISAARTFYAQFTPSTYTITWDCGDGTSKTTTQTYGQTLTLPTEPTRENYAFAGWYTASSGGNKVTSSTVFTGTSNTTYYAHWTQTFSVTVPTSLPLVMDQNGNVNVSDAQIDNHSTGAVEITGITLQAANDWTLVPFTTNMAHEKVDANLVGFSINGAATTKIGAEETLTLTGDWRILQGSKMSLNYDAVISAVSQAVKNETILTVIFVLQWA